MKIKKCAVIGLGHFGYQLSVELAEAGIEVLAIDKSEKIVNSLKEKVALAVKLDSTDFNSLEEIGVNDCDCAVVAIGESFSDSLLTLSHLQELKIKKIVSRVVNPAHEKILKQMNIEEIILPEAVAAEQLAKSLTVQGLVGSFEISNDYSIIEVKAPSWTHNKTVKELKIKDLFDVHLVTVVQIKDKTEFLSLNNKKKIHVEGVPRSDTKISPEDYLLIFGSHKNLKKFIEN